MHFSSDSVETLIEQLSKLPTIGRKSAQRLAAHVLKMSRKEVDDLASALTQVKEKVQHCTICQNVTDTVPCSLCESTMRDHSQVCVVAESSDVAALERTGEYGGVYHVLHGLLSPMDGVGPRDLRINELLRRLDPSEDKETPVIGEIILAVNPTVEGDATVYYLAEKLQSFSVKVTRLARGLPVGSDMAFADDATLSRALAGRNHL